MQTTNQSRGALRMLAFAAALLSPLAQAQGMNRCTEGGKAYYSDKPCPGNGSTRITSYGPTPTYEPHSRGSAGSLQKAPEHQAYLTPECASLNDAIRTARTRGVGYDTQRDLREEYRRKCDEQDAEARRQAYEAESRRRNEAREQRVAQQRERTEAKTSQEQCRELGRILGERRKRLDSMTAGERGDFERFEANFNERCMGR